VYWNEGGNIIFCDVLYKLYQDRLKYKALDKIHPGSYTALQKTIKLMLNSTYGKTIMKKINSKTSIVRSNNFDEYIIKNFNTIRRYRKINERSYEVTAMSADMSFNRGHIGSIILSMSKLVMNEVLDICNTKKYPTYYTDTDSIHYQHKHMKKIEREYARLYDGKKLHGKGLGQFSPDFELDGAAEPVYTTSAIFLGRKSYIDMLESKDEKGKIITGCHKRLKGVTSSGLLQQGRIFGDGVTPNYLELYRKLATDPEGVRFTLNPYDAINEKQNILFEYSGGRVRFKNTFTRLVKFGDM